MKHIYDIDLKKTVNYITFAASIASYYFQFPFRILASCIVPFTLCYLLLNINTIICRLRNRNDIQLCYFLYTIYIGFAILQSATHGINLSRVIRFLIILTTLPLFFYIEIENKKLYYNTFLSLSIIKALIVIGIEIWCKTIGDWILLRHWTLPTGLGDVYPGSFGLLKIQIVGNALLVLALFLQVFYEKSINIKTYIFVIAIFCAGNFAFILGLFCFICYRLYKFLLSYKNQKGYYTPVYILVAGFFCIFFFSYLISQQKYKASYSNAIRIEQMKVLLDCNWFFGEGLGSWIKSNSGFRNYNGEVYFELQTLYIFNQIGTIGLLMFYILTFYEAYTISFHRNGIILYLLYIIYTFWNPYCFDTTHMISIILISNFGGVDDSQKFSYSILSNKYSRR